MISNHSESNSESNITSCEGGLGPYKPKQEPDSEHGMIRTRLSFFWSWTFLHFTGNILTRLFCASLFLLSHIHTPLNMLTEVYLRDEATVTSDRPGPGSDVCVYGSGSYLIMFSMFCSLTLISVDRTETLESMTAAEIAWDAERRRSCCSGQNLRTFYYVFTLRCF